MSLTVHFRVSSTLDRYYGEHPLVDDFITGSYAKTRKPGALACLGNPDLGDMKVYCPEEKETLDDDETKKESPSRGDHCEAAKTRSANGTSASVGRAGRIMRSNIRS